MLPGYAVLTQTVERFGLDLVRKGTLYGYREPRGAEAVTLDEVQAAMERIAAQPPAGGGTLLDALGRTGLKLAVQEAIRARTEVSCAYPAGDLAAEALTEGAAGFGRFDSFSVAGGNDRIAEALVATLPDVRLGSPARRIEWSDAGVRVDGMSADVAVLAVPATTLKDIVFDPPLPERKRTANDGVRYGQAAKLFVRLKTPAPPSQTLSLPGRYWCYTQLGPDGSPLPILAAFAGSAPALEALEVDRGPRKWLGLIAALRPDLELDPDSTLLCTWHDDPWSRCAYSARSATSPLDPEALARPVGALAFAGEHTAGPWHGLMEGALRSGIRAARDLLTAQTTAAAAQ